MSKLPEATIPPLMGRALRWLAILGLGVAIYVIAQACSKPTIHSELKSLAHGEMAKLEVSADAGAVPATSFYDAAGKPLRLADFKGKVVVLNLWATWCPPCVAEMPTLAALAKEYQGKPVAVVAVSIDRAADVEKARQFIAQHPPLAFYSDPKSGLPFAFKPAVAGMPTTIIIDKDGLERARLSGGADWSGKAAKAVVDKVLAVGTSQDG